MLILGGDEHRLFRTFSETDGLRVFGQSHALLGGHLALIVLIDGVFVERQVTVV